LLVSLYELGHQPLGLASPRGFLERAGFAPETLDLSVEPFSEEKVARAVLVAISVPMHTAMRLGTEAAARVRAVNPGCHLCFYGLYASLNAEYLLGTLADSVLGGEYEEPLVALAEALEAGSGEAPPGVVRRRSDGAPPAPASPYLQRLEFAQPSRGSLPLLQRYARLERDGEAHLAGYVEATRGCKHHCRHCPIPPVYGGRFFAVPVEVVLADIRQQVRAGAAHITFGDPDFLNGPGHALRTVRAMRAEFPHLTWDFTAKIEHVLKHRSLFPELGELGCLFMVSAVESLNETVLERLRKGHSRADVTEALEIARAADITLRPSLMPFTPWETLESYLELLEFIADYDLIHCVDPVHLTIRLLVPPGSDLLADDALAPYLGALDPATFSYAWTHPDPRMDHLHAEVSAAVAEAEGTGEAAEHTFQRVRALAYTAAGLPAPELRLVTSDRKPPRLTESWFC